MAITLLAGLNALPLFSWTLSFQMENQIALPTTGLEKQQSRLTRRRQLPQLVFWSKKQYAAAVCLDPCLVSRPAGVTLELLFRDLQPDLCLFSIFPRSQHCHVVLMSRRCW